MSDPGVLVGFGLVFVLVAWTASALLSSVLRATGHRLRQLGPAAERRVTTLAALVPVLLGALVVAALVIRSVAGDDHCAAHDHHAHLCVAHGDGWADRPWVLVLVAIAGATLLARLAILAATILRARHAVAQLRAASTQVDDVRLVDSPRPFCFVAGLWRPEIYASTAAWHGLDPDERDAMLAHERSHVRHRDLRWRLLLEALAAFGAPLTPAALRARWEHATERLRDHDAADEVDSPEAVAGAMIHMCRLGAGPTAMAHAGFTSPPVALDDRVDALLAARPRGERAASTLASIALGAAAIATLGVGALAEPLHHALESLLG